MAKHNRLLIGLMIIPFSIQAEVYRSVDEHGNVTYTDNPPANRSKVEKVEIAPGPSAESLNNTLERNQAIRKAMEEAREKRLEKQISKEERLEKAKKDVEEAEKKLEEKEKIGDDDRQFLTGGKSFIKPGYYERVKKAQQEVDEAKKRLQKIRGY
jgi:predicted membrane-bound mannosyltransferase